MAWLDTYRAVSWIRVSAQPLMMAYFCYHTQDIWRVYNGQIDTLLLQWNTAQALLQTRVMLRTLEEQPAVGDKQDETVD